MKRKSVIIIITVVATISICTVAAMYTPPGFGHSVTMVTRDGGISRHPVLLGLNMDRYVILVTGTVIPPYRGGFRIVLEGDPDIEHKIYSSYPPSLYLGMNHFHDFGTDTITNIFPRDKFTLAVFIKPEQKIRDESHYTLRFYDLKSNNPVLSVPVSFMELDNFNISKNARRPYPEQCEHPSGGRDKSKISSN
ncbi:MAG: hypothetical protein WAL29_04110 [Bacteroidales bacterium]